MGMKPMTPAEFVGVAEKMTAMCSPCGSAIMGVSKFEEQNEVKCADEDAGTLNDDCKDLWCAVKDACPAAEGLTEAPTVATMMEMDLAEYMSHLTMVTGLVCEAAATPAPTT